MPLKIAIATLAVFTLGGCAFRTNIVMTRDLKALTGKDVHMIVKRLGFPDKQEMTLGEKVYTWHINDCTLHVAVDSSEHVARSDYNGSRRECGVVADKLDDNDEEYTAKPLKPNPPLAAQ